MNEFKIIKYQGYCFGTRIDLTDLHCRQLVHLFQQPSEPEKSILGGRTSIMETFLEPIGDVIIKKYKRGGLVRFFNNETYLNLGNIRCKTEYQQMDHAYQLGIQVPKVVAYAYTGGLFYKGWLITEKIQNQQTLASLSMTDLTRAQSASVALLTQISKLMDNHILHPDLHPGNVLVTDKDEVFIIDFDKATKHSGSRKKLASRYLKRWKRAVTKYNLPGILSGILEKELTQR